MDVVYKGRIGGIDIIPEISEVKSDGVVNLIEDENKIFLEDFEKKEKAEIGQFFFFCFI
jgi:hypothetical protein